MVCGFLIEMILVLAFLIIFKMFIPQLIRSCLLSWMIFCTPLSPKKITNLYVPFPLRKKSFALFLRPQAVLLCFINTIGTL